MRQSSKAILMAGVLALSHAGAALAEEEKILNVYNWFDYIGETNIADFEAETGIKVNYDTFDSNQMLETKLLTGGSGYDVVVPTSNFLARQIQVGIFSELDRGRLGGYHNIDPELLEILSISDPGNLHSVPYTWGTTGYAFNIDAIESRLPDAPLDSWDMIFKPEILSHFADCGIAFVDSPEDVVPAVLNYLGKDPNSADQADLTEAFALLATIRPHIKHFNSGQIINDLVGAEICLSLGWNGDASLAYARALEAETGVNIGYTIPKEGTRIFFDVLAVPEDAPHPDNAHKFIDFMLRPENIAGVTNFVFFANANINSAEFVAPEILEDPGTYPPAEIRAVLYSVEPRSLKYNRFVNRAWTEFKLGN